LLVLPDRDGLLIAFGRPTGGDLHAPADPVQRGVHPAQGVLHLHIRGCPCPPRPQEFRTFIARFDHVNAQGLLVCLRETGALTGMVNINSIIRGRYQSVSLGYAAFAPTAGQGIQPGNHASIKLVQRLSLRNEGYSPDLLFIDGAWRDHERWAHHQHHDQPQPLDSPPHPAHTLTT
jgi:[ribosomal protein S5]-alanine N-acetyltransferase